MFWEFHSFYQITRGKWVTKHHPYVVVDFQKKLLYTISQNAKFTANSDPKTSLFEPPVKRRLRRNVKFHIGNQEAKEGGRSLKLSK